MARNVKKFKKVAGNQKIVGIYCGDFSRISHKKSLSKLEIAVLELDFHARKFESLENLSRLLIFQDIFDFSWIRPCNTTNVLFHRCLRKGKNRDLWKFHDADVNKTKTFVKKVFARNFWKKVKFYRNFQ